MLLVVRSFSPSDVGTYHCVSTNSLGRAEGTLRLYGAYTQSLLRHLTSSLFLICFASACISLPHCLCVCVCPYMGLCFCRLCVAEIKLHPGASASNDDHLNYIGGESIKGK